MMKISNFFLFLFCCLLISMIMINLSFFVTQKNFYLTKLSIYECGFNPFHKPSNPFSMSFFLVGILFLIFDLEMILLFPWSVYSKNLTMDHQMMVFMFLMLLVIGLVYEWIKGGLDWQ